MISVVLGLIYGCIQGYLSILYIRMGYLFASAIIDIISVLNVPGYRLAYALLLTGRIWLVAGWLVLVYCVAEGMFVSRIERKQQNRTGLDASEGYAPSRRKVRRVWSVGWAIGLLGALIVWLAGLAREGG